MNKLWLWVVVIIVIGGIYYAVGRNTAPAGTDGVIKIGYVGPFTGPVAGTSGEDVGNGWKLGVKQRPTIGGKTVEVIYEDDACDPKQAAAAAQKLLNVDKVQIVINGVCSGSMLSMAPITEAAKAVLFTPVSTTPKITEAGDYVFRTSASSVHTARAISAFLKRENYKKVALFFENADYPVGIKDAFTADFGAAAGNSIVAAEGFNTKETDMRTQLLKISAAKPDALVAIMNSTVSGNAFIKQARDLGIKMSIVGNEYFGFRDVVVNPAADGIYITQYKYDDMAPTFRSYIAAYEAEYGKKPSQEIYAALPFDGYNVLADAIEKCAGTVPDCVRDALYATKGYVGITGVITIDGKGDTDREFVIRRIAGGALTDI